MMATYFHGGSEIQAAGGGDNLQTLYLMNPNYITAYSEAAHNQTPPNNMLLLNPSTGAGLHALGHASSQQQQLIGIPLSGPHSYNPDRPSPSSTSLQSLDPSHHQIPPPLHGLAVSRVHYNLWNPTVDPSPTQPSPIPTPADVDGQMGFRRPHQGLSLSLSNPAGSAMGGVGDDGRMSVTVAAGGSSSVLNGVQDVIQGSKYLKAAQELLDEMVNVGHFNKKGGNNGESSRSYKEKETTATVEAATGEGSSGGDSGSGSKRPAEQLSTAQRQELQMKKAKLLNMVDEVEQRYRQYHSQMQVIVTSFEQVSGTGSAKTYTSLALQTISRQFRYLKDVIASQIKATNKSLGEEDNNGGATGKLERGAGSRLRFVDHQLRQQRALQQLGMMQNNVWQPQRGLPERAVSVLRAWLFEHFLHPYPKDSDKHMLAKQTGLKRSQVSNWFINARVRLWKPMVEEMYTEEMKSQEHNGVNSEDSKINTTITATNNNATTPTKNNDRNKDNQSTTRTTTTPQQLIEQHDHSGGSTIIHHHNHSDHHTATNDMISTMSATSSQGFTLIGSSSDMESLMAARSPKKQRSTGSDMHNSPSSIVSMDMDMKHDHHHHHHHNEDQRHTPMISNGLGFNPYIVNDIGRFNPDLIGPHHHYHGNGVSLTLGLPHHDQQNFINVPSQGMHLGRRLDIGAGEDEFAATNGYDTIDIQSRTRFAAHFLHDFVA